MLRLAVENNLKLFNFHLGYAVFLFDFDNTVCGILKS